MFRHEDIIIVVSYYEKLGRGYRPSLFSFVCVFGGWLGVGGGNLFVSGFLFPSFVGAMITSHYGFTIFLVRIDQTLSLNINYEKQPFSSSLWTHNCTNFTHRSTILEYNSYQLTTATKLNFLQYTHPPTPPPAK
jgi:hypothetical protein